MMRRCIPIVLTVSLLATSLGEAIAQDNRQQPPRRNESNILPQGRFLKRLRDEIATQQRDEKKEENQRQSNAASQRSAPPARPNANATPSEAGLLRVPAGESPPSILRTQGVLPDANVPRGHLPEFDEPTNRGTQDDKRGKSGSKGFGWQLDERGEKLVITRVERGGNADEAGIKSGDVLVEMGGLPILSMDEFKEISGVLGEGDQIAVRVERNGKPFDRDLQYGVAPEPTAPGATNVPNSRPAGGLTNTPAPNPRGGAALNSNNGIADFTPPIVTPPAVQSARQQPQSQPQREPASVLQNQGNFGRQASSQNRATSAAQDREIQRLQQIILQQQEMLRRMQTELESLKKQRTPNNQRGLFGR